MSNIPTWLAVILTPSAAGFVWVIFKGLDLWRNGTAAQEARAIKNISDHADRETKRANQNAELADYYRTWAGTLEWVIITTPGFGPNALPPRPPLPPSLATRPILVEDGEKK
jgi:hypothetical protein